MLSGLLLFLGFVVVVCWSAVWIILDDEDDSTHDISRSQRIVNVSIDEFIAPSAFDDINEELLAVLRDMTFQADENRPMIIMDSICDSDTDAFEWNASCEGVAVSDYGTVVGRPYVYFDAASVMG